jgi:redox-sensitive bicupin YhaK (pirin superfamily)
MVHGRRLFLVQSGALVAAVAGCRGSQAPAGVARSFRGVARTLSGMATTDGAGVALTRVIGQPALRNLDPFILLDRFRSDDPAAYIRGFPDHPHRGFETVTVMLSGRVRHKDSRGNQGLITGGGAQWMTAGRGIVHSEMPERVEGLMSGFQLWVNLPAAEKMCPQAYQDLQPAQLKEERLGPSGSRVRIIAGDGGPVRARPTQPMLMTVALEDDRPFEIDTPPGHAAFVFVGEGAADVGADGASTRVAQGTIAVLGAGDRIRVRATDQRADVLVAAARPIGEPIVQRGPFVMNTEEEIRRAWDDYQRGVLDRT